jgi:hypothetical protein
MSALSIQPTYPIFTDIDGQPLEAGYVWIGTANLDPQTNPINVYWDAALTILAPQPIRTLAGYPSNNGTPARLYVNSDYSIRVMNKNGSTVYSAPTATERYSEVVFNSNASQVIYDPAGVGAVPTTVQDKLREWVSVTDFGADPTGVADSTTAIRNAMATGKNVSFPYGVYQITDTLPVNKSQIIRGEGNPLINRAQVYIQASGNFPVFEADGSAFPQFIIENFFIQFPGNAVPLTSESATKGNRIGIKITGATRWPEFYEINNVTVRFGWWAYFNDTGSYMGQIENFHARDCLNGFQHRFGTTMTFRNCFASGGRLGFYISNVLACTMTNCGADALNVKVSNGFGGGTGCYFESVQGLTINGWDAEANVIDSDSGGSTATYWRFVDTYAIINGMIGLGTTLKTSGTGAAGGVCWILAENNSNVTLIGCQDVPTGAITYDGTGGFPATLFTADSTSRMNVIGSKFGAATGGSPAISTAATGANIAFTNSLVTGTNTGFSETKTSAGLQIPNVFTQRGDTVVGAGVATNIISLSNTVQAVWMMSIWNPNAGTTYMTTALVNFDGTNWVITNIKAGADLVLNISGTTVQATSTVATTVRWSIVRIA